MKQLLLLFAILISCTINAVAQPPGPPVAKIISPFPNGSKDVPVTRDANFVFNKHYYEAENQWITFPKKPGHAFTKGMYILAFIYFDAQAGYSMINDGLFDIDAAGHAFRDTSASASQVPGIKANSAALYQGPHKLQIPLDTYLTAVIPDKMLDEMKIKKIPDWLPEYRRNNPDTFKTLNKKLLFGHTFTVMVSDVGKHIGENVIIEGRLYGGVTKPRPRQTRLQHRIPIYGGRQLSRSKIHHSCKRH